MQTPYIPTMAIRQAIKALDLEIAELSRKRRGLLPYEIEHLQTKREIKRDARQAFVEYLTALGAAIN